MLLTFEEFQKSKKTIRNDWDKNSFCRDFGWEGMEKEKAILVYNEALAIFETEQGYYLVIENSEYSEKEDLDTLERTLYAHYCREHAIALEDLKIIGQAAVDFEWGSHAQIELENLFFNMAQDEFGVDLESDDWVGFSLKATTPEMVEKALEMIG